MTRLLWIGRERTIESFQGFFTCIGDELASKIVFICSDMWQPYLKVIREKCSQALHILDRFHIVAKMNLSPRDTHGVLFDFGIGRKNRHSMHDGLRHQQPIKRIRVEAWQFTGPQRGLFIDVQ